jgi:hypothetical protein
MPDISATIVIIIILAVVALILLFRRRFNGQSSQKSDPAYAQRFARLLISEIKLYNQEKIESAGRAGNIYQQLKPEIDRARKMYDERVALEGTYGRDYFYEELVRNLAGGDGTKLGRGYIKRGM